jgi:hypothetical protein
MVTDLDVARKYAHLHQSARDRGIEFGLTLKRVRQLLTSKKCAYSGRVFNATDTIRSIDRVDNNKGYIDSNVVASSQDCNCHKDSLSVKEIRGIYKVMVKKGIIK